MAKLIIRVERLSKQYRIGAKKQGYKTVREALVDAVVSPIRRLGGNPKSEIRNPNSACIWALKDVSFEVQPGEVLGIIGRNGAGKSTLLKILSRITEPTEGRIEIRGRVSSLLEVGTGFHGELTGRENVYLNGAIMGMRKAEVDRKFDEIVAFAEVEKFVDTPVKRYSSGMYLRLAFAVAAHLEPEILLVDEVLAVGDAAFQKKCLGKMGDVAKEGRTVLFVSHQMQAIVGLCSRAIHLHNGKVFDDGPAHRIVGGYLSSEMEYPAEVSWNFSEAPGTDIAKLHAVCIRNSRGELSVDHLISDPITLEMKFWTLRPGARINPHFHITNSHGIHVFVTTNYHDTQWGAAHYSPGLYRSSCIIPPNYLNEGLHYVTAILDRNAREILVCQENTVAFRVVDDNTTRGDYVGVWPGVVRPLLPWQIERIGDFRKADIPSSGLAVRLRDETEFAF